MAEKQYIDTSDFSRIQAIIVANGKLYISDCDHQEALEMLCSDIGKSTGLDWSDPDKYDEVQKQAIEITDRLFSENKIQGFDIFEGDDNICYLTAHYPENLDTAYDVIKPFAEKHGYVIGSFVSNSGMMIEIRH